MHNYFYCQFTFSTCFIQFFFSLFPFFLFILLIIFLFFRHLFIYSFIFIFFFILFNFKENTKTKPADCIERSSNSNFYEFKAAFTVYMQQWLVMQTIIIIIVIVIILSDQLQIYFNFFISTIAWQVPVGRLALVGWDGKIHFLVDFYILFLYSFMKCKYTY